MVNVRILGVSLVAVMVWLVVHNAQATNREGSLATCQALRDKAEQYTRLRRAGGSAKQMDAWKRKRDQSEGQFDKLRCSRWRSQLK